jgi:VWFA-related protein
MFRRCSVAVLTLAVGAAGLTFLGVTAPSRAAAQGHRERDLFVSVLTKAGEPVPGLLPDDFIVRENGARREVLRSSRANDPLDIVLLIDNSQVSAPMIMDIRQGIGSFIGKMRGWSQIAVVTFGERPTQVASYSKEPGTLEQAIGRIFAVPGSGAYLLDAIEEVTRGLQKRESARRAIVVLSAGGAEFSSLQANEVLDAILKSGAALHVLTVGVTGAPRDDGDRQRESLIDRGTSRTGGRRENVLDAMGITRALGQLATELLNQYRITYAQPDALIPAESFTVGVRPEGLVVRGTPVFAPRPRQ